MKGHVVTPKGYRPRRTQGEVNFQTEVIHERINRDVQLLLASILILIADFSMQDLYELFSIVKTERRRCCYK